MPPEERRCWALLVNGTGGAGKTATAQAIGRILTARRYPTVVIDIDDLSQFGPPLIDRPDLYRRLRHQSLTAVWANSRAVGARFAVVSGVVEDLALREEYAACLTGCDVQMVRLLTPIETIQERIQGRDRGPRWDAQDVARQHAEFESAPFEDFTVPNDRRLPDVARQILIHAGWPHD